MSIIGESLSLVALHFSLTRCMAGNTRHTAELEKCAEQFTPLEYFYAESVQDLMRADRTERSFDAWFLKCIIIEAWLTRAPLNCSPCFLQSR